MPTTSRMFLLRPSSLQHRLRPTSANAAASMIPVCTSSSSQEPCPWQQRRRRPPLRATLTTLTECNLPSNSRHYHGHYYGHYRAHRRRKSHQRDVVDLYSSSERGRRPTLFQLPGLSHPSDFLRLAQAAISECNSIRRELASSLSSDAPSPSTATACNDSSAIQLAKRTLRSLDQISNVVCTVIDAAELCRSVHASPLWRRGAADAFGLLSDYIGTLNADETLYRSLMRFAFRAHDTAHAHGIAHETLDGLPPAHRRMAHAMRREFERDGIHLPYERREEAREANNVVVGLESLFSSNITEKTKHYDVVGEEAVAEVERIVPRSVLGTLVRSPSSSSAAASSSSSSSSVTLAADPLLTNTLLAHVRCPALRREIYLESHTALPENLPVLDSLIKHRHVHSAHLLGHASYAHRVLADRMAGSPENVARFLNRMEERCRGVYRRDMEMLQHAKRYVEGGGFAGVTLGEIVRAGDVGAVDPWDVPFYCQFVKVHRRRERTKRGDGEDDGDGDDLEQISGYFTVDDTVDGMKALVRELFGIDMVEVDIPLEERWDVDATVDAAAKDGGLRKFEFHHEEEGPLGTMYFDLHPRDGKFVHAAHFTIRCGRVLEPDELGVIETLLHEFGHGLHSLLSRTPFQHLSGTRAAMDFVETPSHLFEHFSRDPSFLSRVLARHYVAGAPLSERRARELLAGATDFRGIDVMTQIVHSRFDQALFGDRPCTPSLGGVTSTEMFDRLHREAGIPHAEGTHWHSRFGHLVTYGAGYYGYLYAQVFAADVWMSCLEGRWNGTNRGDAVGGAGALREGGTKIWKEMLIHGGAKDPMEMLKGVLGREPSVDPFFRDFEK
ncbi:hypothetical protein ACHAXS_003865 [Conticribra weissflogii]